MPVCPCYIFRSSVEDSPDTNFSTSARRLLARGLVCSSKVWVTFTPAAPSRRVILRNYLLGPDLSKGVSVGESAIAVAHRPSSHSRERGGTTTASFASSGNLSHTTTTASTPPGKLVSISPSLSSLIDTPPQFTSPRIHHACILENRAASCVR
jgi:hypothetical protein